MLFPQTNRKKDTVNDPQPLLQPDHDIIIEVRTEQRLFIQQYTQNELQHSRELNDLKNQYNKPLADHELRIQTLEKVVDTIQPEEKVKELRQLESQVQSLVSQMNLYAQTRVIWRTIAAAIGAGIFWVLTQLPSWITLLIKRS